MTKILQALINIFKTPAQPSQPATDKELQQYLEKLTGADKTFAHIAITNPNERTRQHAYDELGKSDNLSAMMILANRTLGDPSYNGKRWAILNMCPKTPEQAAVAIATLEEIVEIPSLAEDAAIQLKRISHDWEWAPHSGQSTGAKEDKVIQFPQLTW